jgi:hypothetical protein
MAKRQKKYFKKSLPSKLKKRIGPNKKRKITNKSKNKSNSPKKRKREINFSRNISLFFRQPEISMEDCSEKSLRDFDALVCYSNESQNLNYFNNLDVSSNERCEINQSH